MTSIKEKMSLKGRCVLITGAAGGLGKIIAETLAELGATLILVDKPGSDMNDFELKIQKKWSVDTHFLECDLEYEEQRLALFKNVCAYGKGLDVLINNAAFVGKNELPGWTVDFEDQSLETWRRAVEVNLTAVFHLSQIFLPMLKERGRGVILNIGSIYGEFGPDWRLYEGTKMGNPAAYAVSKGGVFQLTRWLATTLAPSVRVNAISPGGIYRDQSENFVKRYSAKVPLGRMATNEDFSGAIALLATDMSEYITGEVLSVSGGWGVW